jgi:hypothetical protein
MTHPQSSGSRDAEAGIWLLDLVVWNACALMPWRAMS